MTTITVTISKENDVKAIKALFDRLGIEYAVEEQSALMTKFGILYNSNVMELKNKPINFPSGTSSSDKVLFGVKKALRKLAEETAAKGGSLVVKINGEIKSVPAKELLKTLPKEDNLSL